MARSSLDLRSGLAALSLVAGAGAIAAEPAECAAPLPALVTLAAAEARLARCNRDVRAAEVARTAAEADRIVAGQRPNPQLTVGASNLNPQAGVGSGTLRDKTLDSSLRLEQLIERGGKATLRVQQADELVAAARADLAEAARLQRLALRQAYFDLAGTQERVRLQREFVQLSAASLSATEKRLSAGDIARVEANRIRLDALRAANDLRQAEIELERSRLELAKLLGAESAAPDLAVEVRFPEEAASETTQGERPDMAAARHRVAAAEAARALARSLATRDVTVGMQADRWPVSETNTQGTGISYSMSVSIPLQLRHANEGEARRGLADLDAARAAYARVQAQASAERRLADADWRSARERWARVESDVLPVAREVASASEFAYAKGATGVLDLLDARRSLKAVELDAMQARAEAAKAWARREGARETLEEGAR